MQVVFIGGALDGELREVPECTTGVRHPDMTAGKGWTEIDIPLRTKAAKALAASESMYWVSNGIARHESVSEEEVARRVHEWRTSLQTRIAAIERWIETKEEQRTYAQETE